MKAVMVVGTTSHAGKSLTTAAICRLLARRGLRVTPFKGQNMALNSYITATGGEIGYAQALQAWAAGVEPQVEMNPILLKPQSDRTSQVVLRGTVVGVTNAREYYEHYFQIGWQAITECLEILAGQFDVIVCEGAGSPAEVNLKHRDLTNMRVAKHLNAATILVTDIDRGGCFAQVVGTLDILEPEERDLIQGIVINKFRGQRDILDPGIEWLERRTGIPVLGVVPWIDELFPAEDSLDLLDRRGRKPQAELTVAVVRLPRIANFTDFDPLEAEPSVSLRYLGLQDRLGQPDALILPGSKTTIADLLKLRESGLAAEICRYAAAGGTVLGLCGGLQMMGRTIDDPDGTEGVTGSFAGLDLLPLHTTMSGTKITRQRSAIAHHPGQGVVVKGYEIHQGISTFIRSEDGTESDFQDLFDHPGLGMVNTQQSLWGTYLHGIFENGPWRRAWLNRLRSRRGLTPLALDVPHYAQERERLLDRLTDCIEEHLDFGSIL